MSDRQVYIPPVLCNVSELGRHLVRLRFDCHGAESLAIQKTGTAYQAMWLGADS